MGSGNPDHDENIEMFNAMTLRQEVTLYIRTNENVKTLCLCNARLGKANVQHFVATPVVTSGMFCDEFTSASASAVG